MPYVLLIFSKITTNKHTVQYAKTRIFISKFRSFFCENLRIFLRVFRKITAVATALTTPKAPLIGLFGANIVQGKKNKGVRRQSRTPLPFFVNYETEIYFTINLSVLSLILTK